MIFRYGRHDMTRAQKPWEEIDLAKKALLGVQAKKGQIMLRLEPSLNYQFTAQENGAGRGRGDQNFGISNFVINEAPA